MKSTASRQALAALTAVLLIALAVPRAGAQNLQPAPPPAPAAAPAGLQSPPAAQAAAPRRTRPVEDETPAYKRWWFWALTAVVVGGTVALGAAAAKSSDAPAKGCAPGAIGCFGDGR